MATNRWLGKAADIRQRDTITVALVWAEDDTATITIDGNSIVCTAGSDATTSTVATLIANAINATQRQDSDTAGDYNVGGQTIPQFKDVVASIDPDNSSVVWVDARVAGKPFTMSVTESTAGTGTATEATATAATGKHFWSNAANWSTGSVPANTDDIVFDNGSVSCKYGLPTSNLDPVSFTATMGFTGMIGLPEINTENGTPYYEYRTRYVTLDDAADEAGTVYIGGGQGQGSPMINLNWVDKDGVTVKVRGTGSPQETISPYAFNLTGSGTTFTLDISKGSMSVAPKASDAAGVTSVTVTNQGNAVADTMLHIGPAVSSTIATFDQLGGTVVMEGTSTITALEMNAGMFHWNGTSGTITTAEVYGGTLVAKYGGNITNLNIAGAFDASPSVVTRTVTNATITRGGSYLDPQRQVTLTNGLDVYQCGLQDVTINLGRHFTATPSAI